MADMSHYEKEENLERAAALREYCHARWISAEAETGRIEGGEDGIMGTGDLEAPATFTVIIALEGPQLDMNRLQGVSQALNGRARLVLHGTNDSSPELAKACIRAGVTKFNVNKLVLDPWNDYI
ncbi:hypothetical protein ETB97_011564 [Aspergillus alliaceus]|uniref:Fructose-bisphosphate aldolase n=1 Tax=Petromyces alliaceus TaxID=209559 RepID=A0A8H6A6H2_PETAA|nr:hypothetical protein ETB97_011564 [Aspergillus burnettii]